MTMYQQPWFAVYQGGHVQEGQCAHFTVETPWVRPKDGSCLLCGATAEQITADRAEVARGDS